MDNVVDYSMLQRGRNQKNICLCGSKAKLVVDSVSQTVQCRKCGNNVEPFKALMNIIEHLEQLNKYQSGLIGNITELKYQYSKLSESPPQRVVIKKIDEQFGKRATPRHLQVYPKCPCCKEPFDLKELLNSGSSSQFIHAKVQKRLKGEDRK